MIITEGARSVALSNDEPAAAYSSTQIVSRSWPSSDAAQASTTIRAVVEVYRRISGNPQRALLGAEFAPDSGTVLELKIGVCPYSDEHVAPTYGGAFQHPLVPGLPEEFAETIVRRVEATQEFRTGTLTIDRAAYDPVDSSYSAFDNACQVLLISLFRDSADQDSSRLIRAALRSWR
jgi:hypothetical protein